MMKKRTGDSVLLIISSSQMSKEQFFLTCKELDDFWKFYYDLPYNGKCSHWPKDTKTVDVMISGNQMADLRLKKHSQCLSHVYLGNQNGKQAVKGCINLTKSIKNTVFIRASKLN